MPRTSLKPAQQKPQKSKKLSRKPAAAAAIDPEFDAAHAKFHADRENGRANDGAVRKKRRWHPGVKALREIRRQQKSTNLLIPRSCFEREIRARARLSGGEIRFRSGALELLQHLLEDRIIGYFRRANDLAVHSKRTTVMGRDAAQVSNSPKLALHP